ncbi:MAG: hypothetical protein K8F58_07660 [Bauldia sp.]|nr:hypothetical protein [Bauldia sp.]
MAEIDVVALDPHAGKDDDFAGTIAVADRSIVPGGKDEIQNRAHCDLSEIVPAGFPDRPDLRRTHARQLRSLRSSQG